MKIVIKYKLIDDNSQEFKQIKKGDWIDINLPKQIVFQSPRINKNNKFVYNYQQIPLGFSMAIPAGYEALVVPRSSTFKNYGIIMPNSIGIIDNSYSGDKDEWHLLAVGYKKCVIPEGARVAQFRIQLSQKATLWQKIKWLLSSGVEMQKVDSLGNIDRGGIGSTGIF